MNFLHAGGEMGLLVPWLSWIYLERGSHHRCQKQWLLCVHQPSGSGDWGMPVACPLADSPAPGDPRRILGLERTLVISYQWSAAVTLGHFNCHSDQRNTADLS